MVWIANTEIGLDPNNSVIKRLLCSINHLGTNLMFKQLLCSTVVSMFLFEPIYFYKYHIMYKFNINCNTLLATRVKITEKKMKFFNK